MTTEMLMMQSMNWMEKNWWANGKLNNCKLNFVVIFCFNLNLSVHVEFARGPSRGRGRFRPYGERRGGGGYYNSRNDRPSGGLTYAEK